MEYGLVARAIELLVLRFGLVHVALVGHSGGSSAIMGALSLGIKEGDCIVAASGNYELADMTVRKYENQGIHVSSEQKRAWRASVFNHHKSLGGIIHQRRRIFLVGDITDEFAPFSQQVRYAESLEAAGHRVRLIEATAPNGDGHTFVHTSLIAAARCLKEEDDDRIVRVFGGVLRLP
jgi:acetyl esterase/lipase